MRVLIAPDSFTGTLSAGQAADAIAQGWLEAAPHDAVSLLPLSDGGPGFAEVFARDPRARVEIVTVRGPRGTQVPAQVVVIEGTAYIESAQACGRHLLDQVSSQTVLEATTHGVGDLLREAVALPDVHAVTIGLGGSATNDGGAGLLEALGGLDAARALVAGRTVTMATDVDNPMLGPQGSTAVYGPQKGAKPADIDLLERRLADLVGELATIDPQVRALALRPGAGAAGGLGFALLAIGALRVPGIELVAGATGLREQVLASDLVVTGEGSFDWQSLRGKVVSGVAHVASRAGVPVIVIAGQVLCGRREYSALGIESAYALAESPGEVDAALTDAAATLRRRAQRVARSWSPPRGGQGPDMRR